MVTNATEVTVAVTYSVWIYESVGVEEDDIETAIEDALETLLRRAGIRSVTYAPMASAPEIANPHAAWTVSAEGTEVGVLYQVALPKGFKVRRDAAFGFFEVNTVLLAGIVATLSDDKAVAEIESKLVTLDANVEMRPETFARRLPEIQASLGDSAFEVRVIDTYQKGDNTQYTLRVAYRGLDDQAAKALHKETFGE